MSGAPESWDDIADPAQPQDSWDDIAEPANKKPNTDSPFPQPVMDKANQFAMSPAEFDMAKSGSGMVDAAKAFGKSFGEAWGPERLGLSDESLQWLMKNGVFRNLEDDKLNPFKAINEVLFGATAAVLDGANRGLQATYAGAQAAGIAMGLAKDVVSIPDAFMGTPSPTGIPKPFVKPVEISPISINFPKAGRVEFDSPRPLGTPRSELAKTGDSLLDAVLAHPEVKDVVDNPVLDDSHTVPNSWGGSLPPENPTLYRDKDFPKTLTVDGVTFDTAEPAAIHENVEHFAMDAMTAGGMDQATALKVAFWEFGERAEDAWYAAHGMDPEKVEAALSPYLDQIATRVSDDIPPDLFKGTYPDGDPTKSAAGPIDKPTPEEIQQGRDILTQKLSGRVATVQDVLNTARDLEVIGPTRPEPSFDVSPAEQAELAWPTDLSSAATPAGERALPKGHATGEYDQRGKEWVAKIDQPDDVRAAIEGIANENDWFPEARGGVASPAARRAVAEAAGLNPADMDGDYFARNFDSDGKVRAVIQALRQTAKDVAEASDRVVKDPSVENAAQLAEAQLRHTHVLEYTMGLRADSGRTLAAWKDLLRETEHTRATTEIRKKEATGDTPRGTASVVDAVKAVKDNLKDVAAGTAKPGTKLGIDKLIDQAKNLVDANEEPSKPSTPLRPEVKGLVDEARNVLKQFDVTENVGLDKLIDQAKQLVDAGDEEVKKTGAPLSPELQSMVDAARDALKEPKKTGLEKLVDQAKKLADADAKAAKEPVPISPELQALTDAAKNVLKRFGADKDAGLDAFRTELDRLSTGDGKLDSAVNAARDLLKANEKPPKTGEPKPPTDRTQLMGAAKRLVDAADKAAPEAKTPMPAKTRDLMEAARQAVGRLKTAGNDDVAAFRRALNDGDVKAAQAAAQRLVDAEAKAAPGAPKPPVELDTVMASARKLAKAGTEATAKDKATLPPDIKALVDQANAAAKDLGVQQKSVLDNLVAQAEKQAIDMTKAKAVKDPVEALPPELQALVDKTKRVVDRFGGTARPEQAALLLARTGKTAAEQEALARSVAGLTPNQVAKVLNKLRTSELAAQPKWYYWLWQQGLISGLITHSKYVIVNTGMVAMERFISPVVGAVVGKARGQNASLSSPFYGNMSMIHQVPDAAAGAVKAFKTGQRVPLASEMRLFERGEESPQSKGANDFQRDQGPDWGIWKRVFNESQLDSAAKVLGIPGRSANALHTFFKILSERAAASTTAFETAHAEGVTGDKFWQRYQYHLDNPTDDALRAAVNDAYSGAFMEKLEGGWAKSSSAMYNFPIVGKWVFPFRHIPTNIVRKGVEYSPMAVLDDNFRAALKGDKGGPAQNLAIAKMTVGSSIIGTFMWKVFADEATGEYPKDQKERMEWQLTGKQPFSVKMGNRWVAMERLGPVGMVANLGASLASVVRHYNGQDDEALSSAFIAASMATAGILGNEAGFQTLQNGMDAMNGDEKKMEKFLTSQAASVVPSFLGQIASGSDPYQRKANDLISALKYRVPYLRQSLPVKRDALYGEPLPNPGYVGNAALGLFRASQIKNDPVRAELDRLKIYPTQPQNSVGGVKLPDEMYDKYQQLHGEFTRQYLNRAVNDPGWLNSPAFARTETIQALRKAATETAKAQMLGQNPEIIAQGMKDEVGKITGAKKTKLQDQPTP